MPWKKIPEEQYLMLVTWECDAKCPGCVYEKLLGKMHMPMTTFKCAANSISHFHEITLEGGEPTSHPKFWQMVELVAAKKPQWLQIISNGLRFSHTQKKARAFMSKLNKISTRTGTDVLLRLSVDDFHARALKGGEAEMARRVANVLKVAPKRGNLEVQFCSQRAPRQSEGAVRKKYGLPKDCTSFGVWEHGKSGGTIQRTIITPKGHVFARESHLAEGSKKALGNVMRNSMRSIQRRRH